jgi:hypothetical protein
MCHLAWNVSMCLKKPGDEGRILGCLPQRIYNIQKKTCVLTVDLCMMK